MGLEIVHEKGQTPISEEEKEGLLLNYITTQGELNEAEQLNIEEAVQWTMRKKFSVTEILSEAFMLELHKRMYGDVWRWAGKFRHSDKNIGVDWKQVPIALRGLIDDGQYWINHKTFSQDEIAIRFKHRIVSIHCFPNGNGRHSRLAADVIVSRVLSQPVFTWGGGDLRDKGPDREEYLAALKLADMGNLESLTRFARS